MKVLVACEFSQVVTCAFLERGADAFSCDLLPTIGPFKSRHFQCDVREVLYREWDIVIAHPPCTYMSIAGARYMYPHGVLSQDRLKKALAARDFFYLFYELPCRVCIENPRPLSIVGLPDPDMIVQPYQFGDPYSKETYLWLRRLPVFMSDCYCLPDFSLTDKYHDAKRRSIFSSGIAKAMAAAWCDLI